MSFLYQRRLKKYQEYIKFLNDNKTITRKVMNILRYARNNDLVKYNFVLLGEMEAIFDFYYMDMKDYLMMAEMTNDPDKRRIYLNRAEADRRILDEISEGGSVKPIFNKIYLMIRKVESMELFIKDEDKIVLDLSYNKSR